MALIHVAIGIVLEAGSGQDQVLVAQRPGDRHQGGLLEFPGGKLERGESAREALCRELKEEIGIRVRSPDLEELTRVDHDYGDRQLRLHVFTTRRYAGTPVGCEGQTLVWRHLTGLRTEEFPAANQGILQVLREPDFILITGETPRVTELSPQTLRERLDGWAGNDCLLRVSGGSDSGYRRDFDALCAPAQEAGVRVLVHGAPQRLEHCPEATGLHMPWSVAAHFSERPVSRGYRLGVSCHSGTALAHAWDLGADYAFLSPVRATASHPDREALGWRLFGAMAQTTRVPIHALGGLVPADLSRVREHGGCGVAGIGFWWTSKETCDE